MLKPRLLDAALFIVLFFSVMMFLFLEPHESFKIESIQIIEGRNLPGSDREAVVSFFVNNSAEEPANCTLSVDVFHFGFLAFHNQTRDSIPPGGKKEELGIILPQGKNEVSLGVDCD